MDFRILDGEVTHGRRHPLLSLEKKVSPSPEPDDSKSVRAKRLNKIVAAGVVHTFSELPCLGQIIDAQPTQRNLPVIPLAVTSLIGAVGLAGNRI